MNRTLTAKELSRINRELALALIGASHKAKQHINKTLEILNEKNNTKNSR